MANGAGSTTQLQRLLDRAADGKDAEYYDEVINLAAVRLQRLTGRMLRSYPRLRRWEETSDVFQSAVIRLYRSLTEVRPATVREFYGLAATQIRRTLIDLARHHFGPHGQAGRYLSDGGPGNGGGIIANTHDSTDRPETLASWAEFHESVGRLADPQREVFEIAWYGGLSQREIASLLGTSLPTVKRRLRDARRQLAVALDEGRTTSGENPYE
jgi:RNA polymerase sigma-70 factor (ECF subfamily)